MSIESPAAKSPRNARTSRQWFTVTSPDTTSPDSEVRWRKRDWLSPSKWREARESNSVSPSTTSPRKPEQVPAATSSNEGSPNQEVNEVLQDKLSFVAKADEPQANPTATATPSSSVVVSEDEKQVASADVVQPATVAATVDETPEVASAPESTSQVAGLVVNAKDAVVAKLPAPLKTGVTAACDWASPRAASAQQTLVAVTEHARARASQANATVREVAADKKVQVTAGCAAGGAVVGGTTGAAGGLVSGATIGAVVGLVPALFTFGLSIPIGAAIGGGAGLCVGTAVGSTTGFVAGGAMGYKKDEIQEGAGAVVAKAGTCAVYVKETASASTQYVKDTAIASKEYVKERAHASTNYARGRVQGATGGTEPIHSESD